MRPLIALIALAASFSSVQAASCSVALQDRWEGAAGILVRANALAGRYKNAGETMPVGDLCSVANQMPMVVQTAREYFPACYSGGRQDYLRIEEVAAGFERFRQARCQGQPTGKAARR